MWREVHRVSSVVYIVVGTLNVLHSFRRYIDINALIYFSSIKWHESRLVFPQLEFQLHQNNNNNNDVYNKIRIYIYVGIHNDRWRLFGDTIPTSSHSLVHFSQSFIVDRSIHLLFCCLPCSNAAGHSVRNVHLHHSCRSLAPSRIHILFLRVFGLYIALPCHSTHFSFARV